MRDILRLYASWFSVGHLPRVARSQAGRELRAWALIGIGVGVTEGSVVAVLVKNIFAGEVEPRLLNQAVAIVAGAPALANLLSFYWADYGLGRTKVPAVAALLICTAASMLMMTVVPINGVGLALFVVCVFAARMFWTGAVTLRSPIWRANYPATVRADVTARLTVLTSLSMAGVSALCGVLLEESISSFRFFYPAACVCMVGGALLYRRVRVRRHRQLLEAEQRERATRSGGLAGAIALLRTDHDYRRYMTWMFLFGGGNLMVIGQSVIILNEVLGLSKLQQMLIVSTIPLAAVPLSIPLWARYFDRTHITRFRSVQGWFFSAAMLTLLVGVLQASVPLLWAGAVLLGTGYAGGNLGWHLGHNAFASDGRATDYMALHVSLTGIRGIAAPIIGVGFYQILQGWLPGAGVYALLLPLAMSASGTLGFMHQARDFPASSDR